MQACAHARTQTHTHKTGILLSHKKEENNVICNKMDGPRKYYILTEKGKCYMIPLIGGI